MLICDERVRFVARVLSTVRLLFTLLPLCMVNAATGSRTDLPTVINAIQIPIEEDTSVHFNHLSLRDGLSQTRVAQIIQDDQGFMWFGTQYGLNRHDGYNYRVFTHESGNSNSVGGVYIQSLFKDKHGVLWIGCNNVFDRFDPATERFTHFHLASAD